MSSSVCSERVDIQDIHSFLTRFEKTPPEIIFSWEDRESDAKGWLVINSLRGGAAGGGTRMRKGITCEEVISLAKTMEIKFKISGPPIGGAKSGIDFDPEHPAKNAVLTRWFKAIHPILKGYCGTGGDLHVSEMGEVIPMTEALGLWHPQEGIVSGHYKAQDFDRIQKIDRLRQGVSMKVRDPQYAPMEKKLYTVADLITGFGVAEACRLYYDIWGGSVAQKRVIVQGWGNVASAAALYLAREDAKIVCILDRKQGLVSEDGLGMVEVEKLFSHKQNNALHGPLLSSVEEAQARLQHLEADIFIPAATSRLVSKAQCLDMLSRGLQLIACGANVPFDEQRMFYGDTTQHVDERIALIPDFIANCGMARVFSFLMGNDISSVFDETDIFQDVSAVIRAALQAIHARCPSPKGLTRVALAQALEDLV